MALPGSPARAAPLVDAHSLLLQQQAHSSHSSRPRKCLNHTMDSPATGFCSSGSSPGNEGSFPIPTPLLLAINLPQKNGPWRQLLWSLGASWKWPGTPGSVAPSTKGLPAAWQPCRRLCCPPGLGQNWILLPLGMEGEKGMRQSPALCQRTSEGNCKMISNLGLD